MVKAIGIDIVSVSRIARLLASNHSDRFLRRVLHASELATLHSIPGAGHSQFVAGSWAAKEAVFKTLDRQQQRAFRFSEWYRFKKDEKPQIAFDGRDPDEYLLSLSHDRDNLVAVVLRQAKQA